jgi:hypothetical protein
LQLLIIERTFAILRCVQVIGEEVRIHVRDVDQVLFSFAELDLGGNAVGEEKGFLTYGTFDSILHTKSARRVCKYDTRILFVWNHMR